MVQEQPAGKEMENDRQIGGKGKEVLGVRLGAKDRSYLVRDKQIEVLKNVFGGVEVNVLNRLAYIITYHSFCAVVCATHGFGCVVATHCDTSITASQWSIMCTSFGCMAAV